MKRSCACLLLPTLLLLVGCPPADNGLRVLPQNEREALARINGNLAQIDQPVQYRAAVSFRFRDANDRDRRFLNHEASLIYAPPRYLLFDIRSLTGVVAQFGSNEDRYWVWVEPETRRLWWGEWDQMEQTRETRLLLRPDDLLDVLSLRPLPESLAGGVAPYLRVEGEDYRLVFIRIGEAGEPNLIREILLDLDAPFQALEILDRLPDGRIHMHAYLSRYRRIGGDGPFVPHKYVVFWPLDQAEMRMDVNRAVFRPDLPLEVFNFPEDWHGAVERVDLPAALPPDGEDEP